MKVDEFMQGMYVPTVNHVEEENTPNGYGSVRGHTYVSRMGTPEVRVLQIGGNRQVPIRKDRDRYLSERTETGTYQKGHRQIPIRKDTDRYLSERTETGTYQKGHRQVPIRKDRDRYLSERTQTGTYQKGQRQIPIRKDRDRYLSERA